MPCRRGFAGRRPCTPAGMSSPHPLFYNIAPKGAGYARALRRTFIKTWESVLEHDENSFEDGITRRSPKRSQGEALLSAAARKVSAER